MSYIKTIDNTFEKMLYEVKKNEDVYVEKLRGIICQKGIDVAYEDYLNDCNKEYFACAFYLNAYANDYYNILSTIAYMETFYKDYEVFLNSLCDKYVEELRIDLTALQSLFRQYLKSIVNN